MPPSRVAIQEQATVRTDLFTLASTRSGPNNDSNLHVARGNALVSNVVEEALMVSSGHAAFREVAEANPTGTGWLLKATSPSVYNPQPRVEPPPNQNRDATIIPKELQFLREARKRLEVYNAAAESLKVMQGILKSYDPSLVLEASRRQRNTDSTSAEDAFRVKKLRAQAKQAKRRNKGTKLGGSHLDVGDRSVSSSGMLDTSRSMLSDDTRTSDEVLTPMSHADEDDGSSTDADDEVGKVSRWERRDSLSKRGGAASSINMDVVAAERRLIEANLEAKAEELTAIEKLLEEFRQDQESRVHELDVVQHERSNELQQLGVQIGDLEHRRDAEAQIYDMEMRMKLADMPLVLQRPPKETCDACVGVSEDTLIATKAVAYLARPGAPRLAVAPTGAGVTEPPPPNTRLPSELVQPFHIVPTGRTSPGPGGNTSPLLRSHKSQGALKYNASHLRTGAKAAATTAVHEEYLFVLRGRFGAPDLLDRLWAKDPIAYAAATTQCLQSLAAAATKWKMFVSNVSRHGFVVVSSNGADAVEMYQDLDKMLTAHRWESIVKGYDDMAVVANDNAAADEEAAPITSLIRKSTSSKKSKEKPLIFGGPRLAGVLWLSRVTSHATKTRLRCDYNPSTLRHEFIGQDIHLLDRMLNLAKGGQLLTTRDVWRCVLYCGPRRFAGHILTEYALQVGFAKTEAEATLTTSLAEAQLLFSTATHDVVPLDAVQQGAGSYYVKVLHPIPFELRQRLDYLGPNAETTQSSARRCIAERQFVQPSNVTTVVKASPSLASLSPGLDPLGGFRHASISPTSNSLKPSGSGEHLSLSNTSSGVFPNGLIGSIGEVAPGAVTVLGDESDDTWVEAARKAVLGKNGGNRGGSGIASGGSSFALGAATAPQAATSVSVTETLKDMFPFHIPEVMLVRGFQKSVDSAHIGIASLCIPHLDALLHQPHGAACLQQFYQLTWACARRVVSVVDAHTPRRMSVGGGLSIGGPGRIFVNRHIRPDVLQHGAFRESVTTDPHESRAMLVEMTADSVVWFFRDPMHAVAFGLLVQQEVVHHTGWAEDMGEFYETVVPQWLERKNGGQPLTPPPEGTALNGKTHRGGTQRGGAAKAAASRGVGLKAVIGVTSGATTFELHPQTGLGHFTSPSIDYAHALVANARPGEVLVSPAQRDRILGPTGSVKALPVLDTMYHVVSLAPFSTPDHLKVHAVVSSELRDRQAHLGDLPAGALTALNDAHATMKRALEVSLGRRSSQYATFFSASAVSSPKNASPQEPSSPTAGAGAIAPAPELALAVRKLFQLRQAPHDAQREQHVDVVAGYMSSKTGGLPPRVAFALRALLSAAHTKMREGDVRSSSVLVASSSVTVHDVQEQQQRGDVPPDDARLDTADIGEAARDTISVTDGDASQLQSVSRLNSDESSRVPTLPPIIVPRSTMASPTYAVAHSPSSSAMGEDVQLPSIPGALDRQRRPGDLLAVASIDVTSDSITPNTEPDEDTAQQISRSNASMKAEGGKKKVLRTKKGKEPAKVPSGTAHSSSSKTSVPVAPIAVKSKSKQSALRSSSTTPSDKNVLNAPLTVEEGAGAPEAAAVDLSAPLPSDVSIIASANASASNLKMSDTEVSVGTYDSATQVDDMEDQEPYVSQDAPTVPLALFAELSQSLAALKKEKDELRRELTETKRQLKAATGTTKKRTSDPPPPLTTFAPAPQTLDASTSPLQRRPTPHSTETQTTPITRVPRAAGGGAGPQLSVNIEDEHQSSLLLPQVSIELPIASGPSSSGGSSSDGQGGSVQRKRPPGISEGSVMTMNSSATSFGTDPPLFTPQLTPRTELSSDSSHHAYSLLNHSNSSEKRLLRQSLVADVMDLVQAESAESFLDGGPPIVKFPTSPGIRLSPSRSGSNSVTAPVQAQSGAAAVGHFSSSSRQPQSMNSTQLSANLRDMISATSGVAPWEVAVEPPGHSRVGLPLVATNAIGMDDFADDGPLSPSLPKAPKPNGAAPFRSPHVKTLTPAHSAAMAQRSPQTAQPLRPPRGPPAGPTATRKPAGGVSPAAQSLTPTQSSTTPAPVPLGAPSGGPKPPPNADASAPTVPPKATSSVSPTSRSIDLRPTLMSSMVVDPRPMPSQQHGGGPSSPPRHQQPTPRQVILAPSIPSGGGTNATSNSFTNYCQDELFAPMHRGDVDVPHYSAATVTTRLAQVSPTSQQNTSSASPSRAQPAGQYTSLPLMPEAPQPGSEAYAIWLAALNDQIKGRVESVWRGIR